jgi:poly-D-alanine transfer protein DltD
MAITVQDNPPALGSAPQAAPAAPAAPVQAAPAPARGRPVGLLAGLLAMAIAVAGLQGYAARARRLASAYTHALAPLNLPFKAQTLTLQRAALAQSDLLPLYGTSELYCCGLPYNAPAFFAPEPTGFAVFAVGYPVTGDLFFAETFGALGNALRGHRLVVSDSPWFTAHEGVPPVDYDHTFSPEIAAVFTFDSPLPYALRSAVARQMVQYPETLRDGTVLRMGVTDLALGGLPGHLRDRAAYLLLDPLGRLLAWLAQLQDARATVAFVRQQQPALQPAPYGPQPPALDWAALLRRADALAAQASAGDPFGVITSDWNRCTDVVPAGQCRQALALYTAGRSNRNDAVYAYPAQWARATETAAEWTNLSLELQVLHALGAQPLAWMQPLQGAYSDYTDISLPARRIVYDRYMIVTAAAGVPAATFAPHDADPLFVNTFGHFSPRGWIYADRLLDLYWHGQLAVPAGTDAAAAVDPLFPPDLDCPTALACAGPP